jgi:hypothetical protein
MLPPTVSGSRPLNSVFKAAIGHPIWTLIAIVLLAGIVEFVLAIFGGGSSGVGLDTTTP